MVTSCCVVGCSVSKKNYPEASFFRIPAILRNDEQAISKKRKELWMARINRKNVITTTTLRVCNKHFIKDHPSKLFQSSDPDWAPNQHLGYKLLKEDEGKSSLNRYERRLKRNEQKSTTTTKPRPRAIMGQLVPVSERISDDPVTVSHSDISLVDGTPVNNEKNAENESDIVNDEGMKILNNENTDITMMMSENRELKNTITEMNLQKETLQKQLQNFKFDESKFQSNNENVLYYTGLPHYESLYNNGTFYSDQRLYPSWKDLRLIRKAYIMFNATQTWFWVN